VNGNRRDPSISFGEELARKAIHLCSLSIPVGGYVVGRDVGLPILASIAGVFLLFDGLRVLGVKPVDRLIRLIFGRVIRSHESKNLTGGTYLLLTSTACFWLMPMPAFMAAVTFLVLGDTAAALVGRRWGVHRYGGKSIEGSLACLAICLLAVPIVPELPYLAGALGALAATVAEAFTGPLDDNVAMPIVSGGVMVLFF
jgi:dolichol kinase